jgi:RNA polymerase sigma-B factor
VITSHEARTLLRRYHENGDTRSRDALIELSLPLVRSLARRYAGRGEDFDDLVQVGMVGLIKAVDRFDITRGVEFTTYATPTVIGEIKRHFRDRTSAVRIPRPIHDLGQRIPKQREALTTTLGRSPTISELAKALDADEELVIEALQAARSYKAESLSVPHGDAETTDPMEAIGEEEPGFALSEDRIMLEAGFRKLDQRERRIVVLRFSLGLTQSQIADEVGCSQMHVSRLLRDAITKMERTIAVDTREAVAA